MAGEPAPGTEQGATPAGSGENPLWSSLQQKETLWKPGVVQERAQKEQSLLLPALEPTNQLELGTQIALTVKERDGSICSSFSVGWSLWKANTQHCPLLSPQATHCHCTIKMSTRVLSPHSEMWFLLSSKLSNQENAPEDCSCEQDRVQRGSGLLPCSAAAVHAPHSALASLAAAGASRAEPQELGEGFPCGSQAAQTGISQAERKDGVWRMLERYFW